MKEFQIRDDDFGLSLVEATSPREALLRFLVDELAGEQEIEPSPDGKSASVVFKGKRYEAVPA